MFGTEQTDRNYGSGMNQLAIDYEPRDTERDTVLDVVACSPFRDGFHEWMDANYHVWVAFEFQADRVWDSGRKHYAGRTIIEYLRHSTMIREMQSEFKINDHFTPSLCRLYMMLRPERDGFFEMRERH